MSQDRSGSISCPAGRGNFRRADTAWEESDLRQFSLSPSVLLMVTDTRESVEHTRGAVVVMVSNDTELQILLTIPETPANQENSLKHLEVQVLVEGPTYLPMVVEDHDVALEAVAKKAAGL